VGFSVYDQPARIVRAVASRGVDIAVVWGPLAGYYGALQQPPLRVTPVAAAADGPSLPFAFDMSLAVRTGDADRRAALDRVIDRRRAEIDAILAEYHVPRVDREGS
jgi:mxaJ protein